jgi:hypothetical protein
MSASEEQQHKTRERRKQCVQLALAGVDWQTIADRLEYASPGAAHTDWTRARQASKAELDETVEELRSKEISRIDRLMQAVWAKAIQGEVKAVDAAHRLIITRCKILGLEAPTQLQLTQRIELESTLAAEAVMAAVEALGLAPDARMLALEAAQTRLLAIAGAPDDTEII